VLARERPITYAPMIIASPAASKIPASISASPRDSTAICAGLRTALRRPLMRRAKMIPSAVNPSHTASARPPIVATSPPETPVLSRALERVDTENDRQQGDSHHILDDRGRENGDPFGSGHLVALAQDASGNVDRRRDRNHPEEETPRIAPPLAEHHPSDGDPGDDGEDRRAQADDASLYGKAQEEANVRLEAHQKEQDDRCDDRESVQLRRDGEDVGDPGKRPPGYPGRAITPRAYGPIRMPAASSPRIGGIRRRIATREPKYPAKRITPIWRASIVIRCSRPCPASTLCSSGATPSETCAVTPSAPDAPSAAPIGTAARRIQMPRRQITKSGITPTRADFTLRLRGAPLPWVGDGMERTRKIPAQLRRVPCREHTGFSNGVSPLPPGVPPGVPPGAPACPPRADRRAKRRRRALPLRTSGSPSGTGIWRVSSPRCARCGAARRDRTSPSSPPSPSASASVSPSCTASGRR
jgi:hypothetical protein